MIQDTSTAPALGAADTIREKISSSSVGCGCIGAVVGAVFGTYYVTHGWTENADYALVVTGLVGLGLFFASRLRGYHLLTGFAFLAVLMVGFGAAPLVFRLVYPGQELMFLGDWMRSWWLPIALSLGGVALLVFLLSRMRETISTPEALYAIQVAAATKATSAGQHGILVGAAFEILEACAIAGAWPVDGALVQGDTRLDLRQPDEPLLQLLVVMVRPQEDPGSEAHWQTFGSPPWLPRPAEWISVFRNHGPISVGELLVEPGGLRYLPLRTGSPLVMSLDDLTAVRLALNSVEIEVGGRCYAFQGMHIWRMISLLSYLKGMHCRWDPVSGVVRGLIPKDESVAWPDPPTEGDLADRLAEMSSGLGWQARAASMITECAHGERAERILAGHFCDAVDFLDEDTDAALEAIDAASTLLTALPVTVSGVDLHGLSADLRAAAWVWEEQWESLAELAGELEPWGDDVDPDDAVGRLLDAVEAASRGDDFDLTVVCRGFPDSALASAFQAWSALPDVEDDPEES